MLMIYSVIYPWEDIVGICKKYGVLSLIDAAHSIGQVKTNVKKSDPDFWVSVRSSSLRWGETWS
jgi:selenocysteine lyase/cysteine desulfurase